LAAEKRTGRRQALTPARIVDASFVLIEKEGLDAFSTRKLAQMLRCEAMSIYHYFPSKAHLMDALVDRFIADFDLPDSATTAWRVRLVALTKAFRENARSKPEFFRYFALHRLNTPGGLKLLNWMLGVYFDTGIGPEAAVRMFRLTGYYVTGGLLDETSGYAKGPSAVEPPSNETIAKTYPRIVAAAPYFQPGSFEKTFELGMSIITEALERMVAESDARGDKQADRKRQ
jgi:AcrR family transcriptional regulator